MKTLFIRFPSVVIFAATLAGCGNRYYHDFGDMYEPYRLHLGEQNDAVGARAAALSGAGRASVDSPAALVNNPAGLSRIKKLSFEFGLGYENRALRWQSDSSYPKAEAYTNSFSDSYAAFGLPVVEGRFYVGAAYWVPYDLKLSAGDTSSGGYVESGGAVRSVTPGLAVGLGPAALGFSTDILFGGQDFDTRAPLVRSFQAGFFGYNLRLGFQYRRIYENGWGFALAAGGARGARLRISDGTSYSMDFVPQVNAAGSLTYKGISFYGDWVYNFASSMASEDPDEDYALERAARDTPYYMVGFEYSPGGGIVRGGFAIKPALLRDASRGSVDGRFYSVGGGWPAFGARGFIDVALAYGLRGSMNENRFATGYINFIMSIRYDM